MRPLTSKQKVVLFVITLGVGMMLLFQNCSSSLFMLATGTSAEAKKPKTDFNELLENSENELSQTQQQMKARNELSHIDTKPARYGPSGKISSKNKDMKIRLVRKPMRKSKMMAQSKKLQTSKNKVTQIQKNKKGRKISSVKNVKAASKKKVAKLNATKNVVSFNHLKSKSVKRVPAKDSSKVVKKKKPKAKTLGLKKKKVSISETAN